MLRMRGNRKRQWGRGQCDHWSSLKYLQRWHLLLSGHNSSSLDERSTSTVQHACSETAKSEKCDRRPEHSVLDASTRQTGVRFEGIMHFLNLVFLLCVSLVPTFSNSHYSYPRVLGKVGRLMTKEGTFQLPVPIRDSNIPIQSPREPYGQS